MSGSSSRVALALIGCGGMGMRRLEGHAALKRAGIDLCDLVAVCDLDEVNAAAAARRAGELLGRMPAVYGDLETLVSESKPDALDIVTTVSSHHVVAVRAMELGLHLMVEKPLAITTKAASLIEKAAKRTGRIVSVAENYRRDPMNRLVRAVIDSGALGDPLMLVEAHLSPGDAVAITPWRHSKTSGGIFVDVAVHYADMLQYFLGPVDQVHAWAGILEPVRRWKGLQWAAGGFYESSNRNAAGDYEATAEDSGAALMKLRNGASAQWTFIRGAGGGGSVDFRRIYFTGGTIVCPGDRSGERVEVYLRGRDEAISGEAVLDLAPEFRLQEPAATLFGSDRVSGYDYPFNEADARITGSEIWELCRCIADGVAPEVGLEEGLAALAVVNGVLESQSAGGPVGIEDVVEGRAYAYQAEIDSALGIR